MFLKKKSVSKTDLDPPHQCKKCYTFFFFFNEGFPNFNFLIEFTL